MRRALLVASGALLLAGSLPAHALWSPRTDNWFQNQAPGYLEQRHGGPDSSMAFDESSGNIVAAMGFYDPNNQDRALVDTWLFDGTMWRFAERERNASSDFALAFDPDLKAVVRLRYEGFDDLLDTWDGHAWQEVKGTYLFSTRNIALAYDYAHHHLVATGTPDESILPGQGNLTSILTSRGWSQQRTHNFFGGAKWNMTYDPVNKRMMSFAPVSQYSDQLKAWFWDGADWRITSESFPGDVTNGFELTTDSGHQTVVMLNGADTWVWNGTKWTAYHDTDRFPTAGPAAYDPQLGYLMIFAPATDPPLPGDGAEVLWEWRGKPFLSQSPV